MKRADDESSLVHPIGIARFVQQAFQALHAFASKTDQGVQPLPPVLLRKGQPFRRSGKLRRLVPGARGSRPTAVARRRSLGRTIPLPESHPHREPQARPSRDETPARRRDPALRSHHAESGARSPETRAQWRPLCRTQKCSDSSSRFISSENPLPPMRTNASRAGSRM